MKITKITKVDGIFTVELTPDFREKLFGKTVEKVRVKQDNSYRYSCNQGGVYFNEKGEELGGNSEIGVAIDNWQRRF